MLPDEMRAEIAALKAKYEEPRSALMPAFWIAQRGEGHLEPDAIKEIAELVGVSPGIASGVASFYTLYQREPAGKYIIRLCKTLSCRMAGSADILDHLRDKLGIDLGETTDDGKFSLMTAECLASCGTGPVMLVNDDMHEELTPERVDEVLAGLPG